MKLKLNDELVDVIVVKRLKSDGKLLEKEILRLEAKKYLQPFEDEDLCNMRDDLFYIQGTLEYYGVRNAFNV